jgi:hypothetical protein
MRRGCKEGSGCSAWGKSGFRNRAGHNWGLQEKGAATQRTRLAQGVAHTGAQLTVTGWGIAGAWLNGGDERIPEKCRRVPEVETSPQLHWSTIGHLLSFGCVVCAVSGGDDGVSGGVVAH